MSWHAVRAVREAGITTRGFLLPVDRGRWLRLVLLSSVAGVGWLTPAVLRAVVPTNSLPSGVAGTVAAGAALGLAIAGVVADAYGRFALLSALRSRRLRLVADVRWRLSRAVRWVVFGFGAGVLVVAGAGVALKALRAGWLTVTGGEPSSLVGVTTTVVVGTLAALIGVAVVGVAHATLSLLPAAMLATGAGALGSWRRLWRAFGGHRGGFVGYLLVRGLVAVAVTLVAFLAAGALVAALAVVAFVVFVGVFGTVSNGVAALGGFVVVAAGAGLTVTLLAVPVRAVATTYLAGFDLAVLGAVDHDLELLEGRNDDPFPADDTISVVLPDGTAVGEEPSDDVALDGTDTDEDLGEFQFGAVGADED
jgi:hypothetical protein